MASTKDTKPAELIKGRLNSGTLTYFEYDAQGRIDKVYEAPLHAEDTTPCLLTEYKYTDGAGGTDRTVRATRESVSQWQAAFEFDALP
jgi:hypothetical protein